MARYTGPKHKLSRREGVNLTGTTSPSLVKRLGVPPGPRRRRGRPSDYALRLRAQQRVKRQYGTLERAFRRCVGEARRMPGETGDNLLQLLERRLDSVVYRLGFARTRPMARQLVNHGHILVNARKVTIPSYRVKVGDVLALTPRAMAIPGVQEAVALSPAYLPAWLTRAGGQGGVVSTPRRTDIEADIREDLIVEFYSR